MKPCFSLKIAEYCKLAFFSDSVFKILNWTLFHVFLETLWSTSKPMVCIRVGTGSQRIWKVIDRWSWLVQSTLQLYSWIRRGVQLSYNLSLAIYFAVVCVMYVLNWVMINEIIIQWSLMMSLHFVFKHSFYAATYPYYVTDNEVHCPTDSLNLLGYISFSLIIMCIQNYFVIPIILF